MISGYPKEESQTALDVIATAADRVQTGLDVIASKAARDAALMT